ncbi:hypothetical protein SDC9_195363 [bioreactor metagenome]|uniref:Uncharacterized protein n=1 Tax=bioreactor metagenome TaxID=1076179 RepID=A0A645IBE1_9ZZZZ
MRRAAAAVNVDAVWRRVYKMRFGPEPGKQLRSRGRCRAVGAVYADSKPGDVAAYRSREMVNVVGLFLSHAAHRPAYIRACLQRNRLIGEYQTLDAVFRHVGELIALTAEDLDAVVFIRIV